jgi:hypothetical protein
MTKMRGPYILTPPEKTKPSVDGARWWEQYLRLPAIQFTYANSGRHRGDAPPGYFEKGKLVSPFSLAIPIGYTMEPPFQTSYPSVAILWEMQDTFEHIWWHHEQDADIPL